MFSSITHKIAAVVAATAITATVITGLASPAHAASAGTVSITAGGVLRFTAGADTRNSVTVELETVNGVTGVIVRDFLAPVTTSSSYCTRVDANRVACLYSRVSALSLVGYALDDMIRVSAAIAKPATIDGGAGGDALFGGSGPDTMFGGDEFDQLDGNAGNDTLYGGPDPDVLDGGRGADIFSGGTGDDGVVGDVVDYRRSPAGVTVTIDGVANDGAAGEGDNVGADVEDVYGSPYDDTMTGDDDANDLHGHEGDDVLSGGGGADSFSGDIGSDTFNGGPGVDLVFYGSSPAGVDVTIDGIADDGTDGEGDNVRTDIENVTGSESADTLEGSGAANVLDGRGGDDEIEGEGGDDRLYGNGGFDDLDGDGGTDTCSGGVQGAETEDCEIFQG